YTAHERKNVEDGSRLLNSCLAEINLAAAHDRRQVAAAELLRRTLPVEAAENRADIDEVARVCGLLDSDVLFPFRIALSRVALCANAFSTHAPRTVRVPQKKSQPNPDQDARTDPTSVVTVPDIQSAQKKENPKKNEEEASCTSSATREQQNTNSNEQGRQPEA